MKWGRGVQCSLNKCDTRKHSSFLQKQVWCLLRALSREKGIRMSCHIPLSNSDAADHSWTMEGHVLGCTDHFVGPCACYTWYTSLLDTTIFLPRFLCSWERLQGCLKDWWYCSEELIHCMTQMILSIILPNWIDKKKNSGMQVFLVSERKCIPLKKTLFKKRKEKSMDLDQFLYQYVPLQAVTLH